MSTSIQSLPKCTISGSALELLYRVTLWVEGYKKQKNAVQQWKKGVKKLQALSFIKQDYNIQTTSQPEEMPDTLYIPKNYSAINVMRGLRNIFCHGCLTYNSTSNQFEIKNSNYTKITGQFSEGGLEEFVNVFIN